MSILFKSKKLKKLTLCKGQIILNILLTLLLRSHKLPKLPTLTFDPHFLKILSPIMSTSSSTEIVVHPIQLFPTNGNNVNVTDGFAISFGAGTTVRTQTGCATLVNPIVFMTNYGMIVQLESVDGHDVIEYDPVHFVSTFCVGRTQTKWSELRKHVTRGTYYTATLPSGTLVDLSGFVVELKADTRVTIPITAKFDITTSVQLHPLGSSDEFPMSFGYTSKNTHQPFSFDDKTADMIIGRIERAKRVANSAIKQKEKEDDDEHLSCAYAAKTTTLINVLVERTKNDPEQRGAIAMRLANKKE